MALQQTAHRFAVRRGLALRYASFQNIVFLHFEVTPMRAAMILSLLLSWVPMTNAQTPSAPPARTSVYLEVLGNGGLYSVNVERLVSSRFAARAGFATWTSDDLFGAGKQTLVTVPVLGSFLVGRGSSKLEVGAGLLLGRGRFESAFGAGNNSSRTILDLTGVAGYRYQRPAGGVLFRIGLTPFLALTGGENAYPDSGLFLSGGASVGYSF